MAVSQWCFGDFCLEPANACLWRGAEAVPLPPKAFDVLHYLVTHPDRLVTKDELLDAVWSQTAVSEAVVRVAIGAVRRGLGDMTQSPRYIATVPRRGYRFLAPVAAAPQVASASSLSSPEALTATPDALPSAEAVHHPDTLFSLDAERRPLTVLCCQLVDAPTLAAQLDPEDFREVVRACHQVCADVVGRFDGYLAQYLGDGILAYFGYPLAHEDDAQRAVHAGLTLLDTLAARPLAAAMSGGAPLAVRLGVHTGLVVVGDVGTAARQEPLALGETPQRAAQLQHRAAPNTLVISDATYHRVADYFTCAALDESPRPGLTSSLRGYRVLRPSGVQHRLEVAIARGLTPLVGRVSEVAILQERWARVTAGMGQVVVLAGEAGIGKSRLVRELKDHVAQETHLCWECRGSPYTQHTALAPITTGLQRWLPWQPGDAPEAGLAQLEARLTQVQLPLDATVPRLAALLALPLPAGRYPPCHDTPEQQRQHTFEIFLTLVRRLAERQPVLLIVEDLHWVDPSTLALLTLLMDQVPTMHLYTLFTWRTEFQTPWSVHTYCTPLMLPRLTAPHVAAMVRGMLGDRHVPAPVLAQIVARTDGIPLFVEEVTKAMLEGCLGPPPPHPNMQGPPEPALAIPTTLHEALLGRLDRLGGSAKGVAQLGAILGSPFAYTLLRAVAAREEAPLQRDLATLVAAEILYQRGHPPDALYTFKHALIQEAAYASVLQRTRRSTHQRIVQVLETQFPAPAATAPERLAHHALRGECWTTALAALRHVAEYALARSAAREAAAACEQALRAVQHLPPSRDTRTQALDLHLLWRTALLAAGDVGTALVALREAESLAVALDDLPRLSKVSLFLATAYTVQRAYGQALTSAKRALALTRAGGDDVVHAQASQALGHVYQAQGAYQQASEAFAHTVAFFAGARGHDRHGEIYLPAVNARARLAVCYAELGQFAAGQEIADAGFRMAETAAHPTSLLIALWGLGLLSLRHGDVARARALLERARGLTQGAEVPVAFPRVATALGEVYTLTGRVADALTLLTQAVAQTRATAMRLFEGFCDLALGEAQMRAGRLEEAQALATHTLARARQYAERGHEAQALHLLGMIAAQGRPPDVLQAVVPYHQALTLAEALGMRPLQAHCHRGLGTLYATIDRREQARTALSTAIALYQDMDMTFWLPQVEAALA